MGALGQDAIETIRVWVDHINQAGGINGHLLEIVFADDASDETTAVMAAKKLIEVDKVIAIVGPIATGVGMALMPICEKAQIPLLSCTGSMIFDVPVRKWCFRPSAHEFFYFLGMDVFMKNNGIHKIGALVQSAAAGKGFLAGLQLYLKAVGSDAELIIENYAPTDKDMTAQLTRLSVARAQMLIVLGAELAGGLTIKQARDMGLKQPIWCAPAIVTPAIVEAVGKYMEIAPGTFWCAVDTEVWDQLPENYGDKALCKAFNEAFLKTYNHAPGPVSSTGLAIVTILQDALNRSTPDPNPANIVQARATLRDAIEATKGLWCGEGQVTFSPTNHHGIVWGIGWMPARLVNGKRTVQWDIYNAVKDKPAPPGYYPEERK